MPALAIAGVDLIPLIVAGAALLAVSALWVFWRPIGLAIHHVWVIGPTIDNAVTSGLEAAMRFLIGGMDSLVHSFAHLIYSTAVGAWHLVYKLTSAVAHATGLAHQSFSYTDQSVSDAQAAAAAGITAATVQQIAGDAATLGQAEALYNASIAHADAVGATVLGDAEGLYNAAVWHADAVGATVLGQAEGLYNASIAHADQVGATVLGDAEGLYNAAIAHADAIGAAIPGELAGLLGTAEGYASDVATAAAAAAAAGVLAQTIPRVVALEAEAAECLKPLCDTVTPAASQVGRLGRFLQGLETLGVDVVVAGLFVEAATNPAGVAREVVTVMEAAGEPVIAGVRALASL